MGSRGPVRTLANFHRVSRVISINQATQTVWREKTRIHFGERTREARLRWLGHVRRKDDGYTGKWMLRMELTGKRERGRPKRMSMDVVREEMAVVEVTGNGTKWRWKICLMGEAKKKTRRQQHSQHLSWCAPASLSPSTRRVVRQCCHLVWSYCWGSRSLHEVLAAPVPSGWSWLPSMTRSCHLASLWHRHPTWEFWEVLKNCLQ